MTVNLLAYTYHKNGRYEVKVVDLNSGKTKTIAKGGYLINDQVIDYHLPLIDWQDNNNLGVLLYKRGYLYLNTYNISTGDKLQKPLSRFRQVESFSFNDNGRLAIISGDVDGQNDLFLISMRRNALKRITDDLYDDLDPVFIPGSAAIVFSSNRAYDSVRVSNISLSDVDDNFNLFLYDLDTTTTNFTRLTNTFSKDSKPLAKNDHTIYYISDQRGIQNLYKYSLLDSTFVQVSNFEHSINDFDIAHDQLAYLMLDQGRMKVFHESGFDLNQRIFTPQTARQRMIQAKYVVERVNKQLPTPTPTPKKEFSKIDSLVLPDSFFFEDETTDSLKQDAIDGDLIDTDNYVFEDEVKTPFKPESFFSNYKKFERESRVIGPQAYEPRFSFNNLITSFAIDPIRGFSILLETEINDLLGKPSIKWWCADHYGFS